MALALITEAWHNSVTAIYERLPDRGGEAMTPRSLVWLNRQGQEEPTGAPLRTYGTARAAQKDDVVLALESRDLAERPLARVPSNESGRDENLCPAFSRLEIGRILISTAGGTRPAWAPNDRESRGAGGKRDRDDPTPVQGR
jgi:hypothetical protein